MFTNKLQLYLFQIECKDTKTFTIGVDVGEKIIESVF